MLGARSYGEAEYWFSVVSVLYTQKKKKFIHQATVINSHFSTDQNCSYSRLYHCWLYHIGWFDWVCTPTLHNLKFINVLTFFKVTLIHMKYMVSNIGIVQVLFLMVLLVL